MVALPMGYRPISRPNCAGAGSAARNSPSVTLRGTVPIGWTVQPLLADFDPAMLNYFWSTATTNDCLVAGPSGAGYTRINYWSAGNVASYTKASNFYLQRSGIRDITVWLTVSSGTGNTYATNCPTLIGINDQNGGYYTNHYGTLPVIGFPGSASYASTVSNLVYGITNTAAGWSGTAPMFIAVQGSAWNIKPADCQTVANSLDPAKYVVVRPDHLFLLYQEALGLGNGGAAPYIVTQPASQLATLGTNITFTASASGTGPLKYQWRSNGANIAGATNSTCTVSNVQASDAGSYQVVVANAYGLVMSSPAVLTFGNQPVNFNGNGLNWTVNQNTSYFPYSPPAIANNILSLTDGGGGEARSFFYNSPQYVGAFKAAFTYQAGGNKAADGIAFCLQNDPRNQSALGGGGGQLGVGTANPITPSIELELNLFTGGGAALGYTVLTNGLTAAGGTNGNYHAPGSLQINSGDPINIAVSYANQQMMLTFTDAVAHTSFATNLNVGDLTQIVGTNAAYIGFTGADGGSTSIQTISNFSFLSIPPVAIQPDGSGNVLVSWSSAAPGYIVQRNPDLTGTNWVNVSNDTIVTNGFYQVTEPENASNCFYRLALPSP